MYFLKRASVALRAIEKVDKDKFLQWHNDLALRNLIGGIFPLDEGAFQKICDQGYEKLLPSQIWFSVCYEDKLVGIAGLHNVRYVQRNAEVACFVGENQYRQQGIGSAVVGLIEEYAFGTLNLHRIYAYVYDDNIIAKNFFAKQQWLQEGLLREASYWNYTFRDIVIFARINKSYE